MRDVLGNWVLRADGAGVDTVALAGLGHGVVARVEVLAVLEVLGEVVGARGELAVEPEEALFFGGERLNKEDTRGLVIRQGVLAGAGAGAVNGLGGLAEGESCEG